MILFDAFSFKKSITGIFSIEVVKDVLNLARKEIIERVDKAISGEEKKVQVDYKVIKFIQDYVITNCTNKLVLWLVNTVVIKAIPTVTQLVYEFLKEKVNGLTKLS